MSYSEDQLNSLKSTQPDVYHRTFRSEFTKSIDDLLREHEPPGRVVIRNNEGIRRAPTMGPPSGTVVNPSGTTGNFVDAYYEKGEELIPTRIWSRADQDFKLAATPWEQWWSILFKTKDSQCIPIIDSNDTVIGHHCVVIGPKIYAMGFDKSNEIRTTYSFDERFAAWDLLIANGDAEEAQGYRRVFTERYRIFEVQVGIDGFITSGKELANNNGHAVEPDIDPFDLLTIGRGVIKVAGGLAKKVGAKTVTTIVRREAVKRVARSAAAAEIKLIEGYDARMGIPAEHFTHMAAAAKETQVIAIFRANKAVAIPLIRKGAHGKPMWAKFKSSPQTGVLTASNDAERLICYRNGAYVVHADTVASKQAVRIVGDKKEYIKIGDDWKIEEGQVFMKDGKPIVGDYDLLGVAPAKSPGSNVSSVPDDVANGDWNGPWVKKYAKAVNDKLGEERVLHGAQDGYGGKPEYAGLTDDTAYAIFPNGKVHIMEGRTQQEAFYEAIGRKAKSKDPAPVGESGWKPRIVK